MGTNATKDMPLSKLKAAPYNPPNRTEKLRLAKLTASVKQHGLLYEILVTPQYVIIDGHRRAAVAKLLGWKSIPAKVVSADPDSVYASINPTPAKMGGNDSLGVWLRRPQAVAERQRKLFEHIEGVIGRPLMERMYGEKLSARVYHTAVRIARYCDAYTPEQITAVVKWLMEFAVIGQVMKALELGESPALIMKAVKQRKPIKFRLAIAG